MVWATIFPNQLHYQALARGEWLFWLNDLGFGTPLPIGDPFAFHPVFGPFAALASLRATFTAVWLVHIVVMVVYFLRLAAISGISPPLRFVLLALYLGSVVSMTYFYDTDWLNFMIAWSLYPVLVFYLRSAILGEAVTKFWPTTLRLALLFGFWINNAHPGHIAPLVTVLAIYALAAAPRRRSVYACLALGAVFCLAISAERIYTLVHEASLFPPGTPFTRNGLTLTTYVEHALNTVPRSRRAPFIGLGLGLAAVASVVQLAKLHDPHVRACAVAFAAALTLSLLPPSLSQWYAPSGTWLLRDAVVFFGLLAGGNILQRGLRSPHLWRRGATVALVLIQAIQQWAVVTWPSVEEFLQYRGPLLFYRYQGRAVGLGQVLVRHAEKFGPRVYLSRPVEDAMRGRLSRDGIHFSSDLVFLGLNPVNGWFKNVSMDRLYPSESLMESFIRGDRNAIENDTMLDVLGVNIIVTTDSEGPSPPGLQFVERVHLQGVNEEFLILANPDAWPQAVLMEAEAYALSLPQNPGCLHRGALCRDYQSLATRRLPDTVALTRTNGRYVARFPPSDRERLLFVSATYRAQWRAISPDGPVPLHPVAGAFLGVTVPAGITDITIAYVPPRAQIALIWFSSLTLIGVAAMFCVALRLERSVAPRRASAADRLADTKTG
jgi:hypothetical protein